MPMQLATPKIRPDHLARLAWIYVRQSTLAQVREHVASTARQYDLQRRALELGWAPEHLRVIDQDQGHSGASSADRDGFQTLVAEVGLGHAGAVLSLEVSRLARSCSDWYRLLEICALTDTLVIDEDGVYDPGQYTDRLVLGFMGTMSEAELHWLRHRLLGGRLAKAEQGTLRFRPPTGFVLDLTGQVVLDPDEEVQQAVRLVFALFEQWGSALAVVKHFTTQQLRFPTRLWGARHDGEVVWDPLPHHRVLNILHNPAYAGVYVYGRTRPHSHALPGAAPQTKGHTRVVAEADWPIVRHNAHPGYISWEQFQRNKQRLDDNRTFRAEDRRGAVREGAALLQGIVRCGKCGQRMSVRYRDHGRTPRYECDDLHARHAGPTCQSMCGAGIDAAVAQLFLDAIEPAQLAVSLATLADVDTQARQIDRQWQLRLERVRYEADLARRRVLAVEPEHRLVARTLERDWNDKLAEVERLEREYGMVVQATPRTMGAEERQRILALATDLPAVWHAPTTTHAARKQLLRYLIKDVTVRKRETSVELTVRWQTGVCSTCVVPHPLRSYDRWRTDPAVLERVRELAHTQSDREIATLLAAAGYRAKRGGPITADTVAYLRWCYTPVRRSAPLPEAGPPPPRCDGRYSARVAAALLTVDVSTIADWCAIGRLHAVPDTPHHARQILLTPDTIAALRKPVRQRKPRRCAAGVGTPQEPGDG